MAINQDLFAPASGIGPQVGGFNPTPASRISAGIRENSSVSLMEYALRSSPRVRAATGLLATGLAGDPNQADALINNSTQGKIIQDLTSAALGAGLIPGGSPVQLAGSIQQMVASQGFSVGGNIGRNSPVFGGGAITDMMSKTVFDSIKDNFFDPISELPKRAAHGMDMSQMADATNLLTSRGAFSGMEIGNLDINDAGEYEFKLDKDKMKNVNKVFSDYAGMLKDAKQIFGDLPIAELTQNAERLVGTSIRDMGAVSNMRNRMANIQATSSAYGLNPEAVAGRMMSMTDTVQRAMYTDAMSDPRISSEPHLQAITSSSFGRMASDISEASVLGGLRAANASTAAANLYAAQGKYMPDINNAQAEQILAGTMQQMMTSRDNPLTGNVLAASHMLSVGKIQDPETAAKVKNLIGKTMSAGDKRQTAAFNQEIADTLASAGIHVENYKLGHTDASMLRELDPTSSRELTKGVEIGARRRHAEEGASMLNITGDDYGLFRDDEGGEKNRENFADLIQATDKKAQDALFASVGASGEINEEALNKAYETMPGLSKVLSKDQFRNTVATMTADSGRAKGNVKDQMTSVMDTMRRSAGIQALGSEREKLLADERAVFNYLSTTSLGGKANPESFGVELMRGFFGTGQIDNQVVLQSLKNEKKASTFDMKADKMGLVLNEESLDNLSSVLGQDSMKAIANQLGLDVNNKKEMAAALGTASGFAALQANLGTAAMGVNADNTISLASGSAIEEKTKVLETEAMTTAAKRLLGKDTKVGTNSDLNTEEGRTKYNKDLVSELTKDKSSKIEELANKFKENKYSGQEFESLALLSQSNPNIRKAIRDSANEANAAGDKQKYVDIMSLDRNLQSSASSESNRYLGVLDIMAEGMTQLKLWQQ
jgi:hypothetical protein